MRRGEIPNLKGTTTPSARVQMLAAYTSAHRINQGSIPDLSPPDTDSDFYFVPADDPETAVGRIFELVKTRDPQTVRPGSDP